MDHNFGKNDVPQFERPFKSINLWISIKVELIMKFRNSPHKVDVK